MNRSASLLPLAILIIAGAAVSRQLPGRKHVLLPHGDRQPAEASYHQAGRGS